FVHMRSLDGGKIDLELRPSRNLAVDVYKPAMTLHYGDGGRKSESGSLSYIFRRKERLEDLVYNIGRNGLPRIRNRYDDESTRLSFYVHSRVVFIDNRIFGSNEEPAAFGHRIPRVHRKIHQYLIELRRVAHDGPQIFRHVGLNSDRFRECL